MRIDIIQPHLTSDATRAFFTLKNSSLYTQGRSIDGLNLGYNTNEAPEIITQNRKELFAEFDIDTKWIAFANQVHSNRVKVVTRGGTFADTDGLITQVPGLALVIQVADCAAVLFADESSSTIAAIHAGWRGAAGDIIPLACQKMRELGADIHTTRAFISPCIGVKNFEVGSEVADQFPDSFVNRTAYAKVHVNLKEYLRSHLQEEGVEPDRIEVHPGCTVEESRFYSYRREQDESGRMMAVIQIKPPKI